MDAHPFAPPTDFQGAGHRSLKRLPSLHKQRWILCQKTDPLAVLPRAHLWSPCVCPFAGTVVLCWLLRLRSRFKVRFAKLWSLF